MKKIAFILRMFQEKSFHGGGEKLFYNLIKQFSLDGFKIDIYCSESDVSGAEFVNKIVVINEPYDHNKPETMEKFYKKAKELIKKENYDHVISENITPPVDITFLQGHSLVNRLKNVKNPVEAFFYKFRKVKKERVKHQKKWMKEGYKRIFTVSETLKKDIVNNFGILENKISVIYPGVIIPEKIKRKKLEDTIVFGLIAPGFKIKGGFVFLKALKMLKNKGYKFKAKVIYPKYKKNIGVKMLVFLYNLKKEIEFLPYQQNIGDFYSSIDCLVAPSIEDTFNIAALEAMAYSKPCIISKNAGASEIIENKVNGLTFNVKKNGAKNLYKKMQFLLKNPKKLQKISKFSIKTAKKYTWERFYNRFSENLKIFL